MIELRELFGMTPSWGPVIVIGAIASSCAAIFLLLRAARTSSEPAFALIPFAALLVVGRVSFELSRLEMFSELERSQSGDDQLSLVWSICTLNITVEMLAHALAAAGFVGVGFGAFFLHRRHRRGARESAIGSFASYWWGLLNLDVVMDMSNRVHWSSIYRAGIEARSLSNTAGCSVMGVILIACVRYVRTAPTRVGVLAACALVIAVLQEGAKKKVYAVPTFEKIFPRERYVLDGSPRWIDHLNQSGQPVVSVMPEHWDDGSDASRLRANLVAALQVSPAVQFIAPSPRDPPSPGREGCGLCSAMDGDRRAVPLEVRSSKDECRDCAAFDTSWKRTVAPDHIRWDFSRVLFDWRTGDVDALIEAATLAWHNGHVLSVVVTDD